MLKCPSQGVPSAEEQIPFRKAKEDASEPKMNDNRDRRGMPGAEVGPPNNRQPIQNHQPNSQPPHQRNATKQSAPFVKRKGARASEAMRAGYARGSGAYQPKNHHPKNPIHPAHPCKSPLDSVDTYVLT